MFLSETKQHSVPIPTNIPDQAYEAVLPCHLNLGRLSQPLLAGGFLQFRVAESAG